MKAALDKRLQVSERLARMVHVAQGVDDWNTRGCRKANHCGVRVHARHDGMAPALDVFAVIADGFAGAERCFAVLKVNGLAAHTKHSNFETHARSQRWLLKEHAHALAGHGASNARGVAFEFRSRSENVKNLMLRKIAQAQEVFTADGLERIHQ
jgi:hypothetical protein